MALSFSQGFENLLVSTQPKLRNLLAPIYTFLISECKCNEDAKSDYATFGTSDGMVAAIYPYQTEIDLVLALPFDKDDKVLFLAVDKDYKWRTLPSGICITNAPTARAALDRVKRAFDLVESGELLEQDGAVFARPKAAFQPAFKKKLRFR